MLGYKGFNLNDDGTFSCRDFTFEIGRFYICKTSIEMCSNGFHFCPKIRDVFSYYHPEDAIFCEVEAHDEIIKEEDKCCTSKIYIKQLCNGIIDNVYFKEGRLHREDGPAIEYSDGLKGWYKEGKCHRDDGPAIEHPDGIKIWYKEGNLHRDDGPVIEYQNGIKE